MTTIQHNAHTTLPKQFGQYKLIGVLGEGSTSVVAEAIHCETGKSYAVKIIDIRGDIPEHLMNALEREIRILSRLNHPNIVKLIEVIRETEFILIVMEHCEGGTLLDYLLEGKLTSRSEVKRLFRQIALGICYLHNQGISHGDIKPDNIVLTREGDAKIIDFGYCRECLMCSDSEKAGTIKYAAPELLRSGIYNTEKADVWSLGILLFVMATGSFPYYASDDELVRSLVLRGHMAPPSRLGSDLSGLYADMTKRFPQKRPTVEMILNSQYLEPMKWNDIKDGKTDHNGGTETKMGIAKAESEDAVDEMTLF
jgi:serine/threonine protein kinase